MNGTSKATPVLHLIDSSGPGGAETIFVELASSLDGEEWRSLAMVPREGWVSRKLEERGVRSILLESSGRFNVRYLRSLVDFIRSERVGLVHTHLFGSALYGGLAGLLTGIPVINTLHGEPDLPTPGVGAGVRYRVLRGTVDTIVLVSGALREAFHQRAPFPEARTRVIYNGIDPGSFRPSSRGRSSLRSELGVDPSTVVVGAVGNFRPAKGLDVFTKAADLIARARSDVHFVIAGEPDGAIYPEVLKMRGEAGLDDRLTLLGFRAEVARVFQGIDIFVSSSYQEGFSLTTVQAMAGRIPVVATRSGGPEEILRDGVTGLLVPTGSPEAIAEAVLRLLDSESLRVRIAAAGQERALSAFSLQQMVASYADLYRTATK